MSAALATIAAVAVLGALGLSGWLAWCARQERADAAARIRELEQREASLVERLLRLQAATPENARTAALASAEPPPVPEVKAPYHSGFRVPGRNAVNLSQVPASAMAEKYRRRMGQRPTPDDEAQPEVTA